MSAGFGFSAGDFIAALKVVSTVADALRESGDSSTEYRAIVNQVYSLETALLHVKRLEVDEAQHDEVIALQQAACQCQRTISAFWDKIKTYQPSLSIGGSGSRLKDIWKKIHWALCRKEDIVKFKADLVGHTESIELLLMTIQISAYRSHAEQQGKNHKTLAGKIQESYFGCMQRLSDVADSVSSGIQLGQALLEMAAKIIQINVQIFQVVLDIQSVISTIPGQVKRQQPVYLKDPRGRHMPFHLEFITSAEALGAVLQLNFKDIESVAKKLRTGKFGIQDIATNGQINLSSPWATCFRLGQHVAISVEVQLFGNYDNVECPACLVKSNEQRCAYNPLQCLAVLANTLRVKRLLMPRVQAEDAAAPDARLSSSLHPYPRSPNFTWKLSKDDQEILGISPPGNSRITCKYNIDPCIYDRIIDFDGTRYPSLHIGVFQCDQCHKEVKDSSL